MSSYQVRCRHVCRLEPFEIVHLLLIRNRQDILGLKLALHRKNVLCALQKLILLQKLLWLLRQLIVALVLVNDGVLLKAISAAYCRLVFLRGAEEAEAFRVILIDLVTLDHCFVFVIVALLLRLFFLVAHFDVHPVLYQIFDVVLSILVRVLGRRVELLLIVFVEEADARLPLLLGACSVYLTVYCRLDALLVRQVLRYFYANAEAKGGERVVGLVFLFILGLDFLKFDQVLLDGEPLEIRLDQAVSQLHPRLRTSLIIVVRQEATRLAEHVAFVLQRFMRNI